MRMANTFNPQQLDSNMQTPTSLPIRPTEPPLINSPDPRITLPLPEVDSTQPDQGYEPYQGPSTLDMFRQNVLNFPDTGPSYPKNTLAGLQAGLQIAAEPSPTSQNRVYVDGKAYQKGHSFIDPVTKQKHYITDVHDPSFMQQVMRAMPAAVSPVTDILNQPGADAMADWESKNKAYGQLAGAESQAALANQRNTTASLAPRALDIKQMDAETRAKLAAIHDMTDSEKIAALQSGKVTIAEIQAAAAMARTQANITGQKEVQGMRGTQAAEQIAQRGRIESQHITQRGGIQKALQEERAKDAIKLKQTPGMASSNEYQQKLGLQNHVAQLLAQNPEWGDYLSFDEDGLPILDPVGTGASRWSGTGGLDQDTHDEIYQAVFGAPIGATVPPRTSARPPAAGATPPATNPPGVQVPPPNSPGVQPIIQQNTATKEYRISYDGGKTWRPYNPTGTEKKK